MAASSSLQLRAISNLGTWSATATTNCELKTIIDTEIGMVGLLLLGRHRIAKMHSGRAFISFEKFWVSSMQKRTIEHRGPIGAGRSRNGQMLPDVRFCIVASGDFEKHIAPSTERCRHAVV